MSRASAVMTANSAIPTDPEFSRREAAEARIPNSFRRRVMVRGDCGISAPPMTPAGRAARNGEIPDAQAK